MTAIRQPVLGVHDLVPPEGRVCVELINERGKTVHKVRSENAITDMHRNMVKRTARGIDTISTSGTTQTPVGYHFHGGQAIDNTDFGANQDEWWRFGIALDDATRPWDGPTAWVDGMRCILLSDSNTAVDTAERMFPGNLTGLGYLREPIAPGTNLKLTQLVLASSYRTPTALRYVCEWGTAYGNGDHNSVGIGCAQWDVNSQFAWPCFTTLGRVVGARVNSDAANATWSTAGGWNYREPSSYRYFGPNLTSSTSVLLRYNSAHYVSASECWVAVSGVSTATITKHNFATANLAPFSSTGLGFGGYEMLGPTMTTVGASANPCGLAIIGSDFWLAYAGTLKRCVKPVGTGLTVTNTYTPGGIENCIDLTTDGTWLYWLGATNVYKIDATTGAIDSSWAHGLAGTPKNIAWDGGADPGLLLSQLGSYAGRWNTNNSGLAGAITVLKYSTGGVFKGENSFNVVQGSSANYPNQGILCNLDSSYQHFLGGWSASAQSSYTTASLAILGPSHISRTVLPSTVTKTAANSMRVTYEFVF